MILQGQKITLRTFKISEKQMFYEWATNSQATPYLYGDLYGNKIPTYEELFNDFKDYFFDGSKSEWGRCFVILFENEPIGQINYNKISRTDNSVELDIWIAKSANTSKGLGSDALKTLMEYLREKMNVKKFLIFPSVKNPRAVKAYKKAGFQITHKFKDKNGSESYYMEVKK